MNLPSTESLFINSNLDLLGPFFISSKSIANEDLFRHDLRVEKVDFFFFGISSLRVYFYCDANILFLNPTSFEGLD